MHRRVSRLTVVLCRCQWIHSRPLKEGPGPGPDIRARVRLTGVVGLRNSQEGRHKRLGRECQ